MQKQETMQNLLAQHVYPLFTVETMLLSAQLLTDIKNSYWHCRTIIEDENS